MPTAEAKIVFDDEVEEPISRMIFIAGMNQYCEGGGVPMAPEAVATDRRIFSLLWLWSGKVAHLFPAAISGKGKTYRI